MKDTPRFLPTSVAAVLLATGLMGQFPAELDFSRFSEQDGLALLGASPGDKAGASLAPAGDVNGDGLADLIIGAPSAGGISEDYDALKFSRHFNLSDVDGDGDVDAVGISAWTGEIEYRLNDGGGNFGPLIVLPAAGAGGLFVAAGDVDGDGDQDLVAAHDGSDQVSVWMGDGAGAFALSATLPVGDAPNHVLMIDLDGDLDPDIATSNVLSNDVTLLFNDGSGAFPPPLVTIPAGERPSTAAGGDLNADGIADLAIANQSQDGSVSVMLGLGGGVLGPRVEYSTVPKAYEVLIADLDGDGWPDVAVGGDTNQAALAVLRNAADGTGQLLQQRTYPGGLDIRGMAAGDFDLDGDLDLATSDVDADPQKFTAYWNDGLAGFELALAYSLPSMEFSLSPGLSRVSAADADGDGDLDFAVALNGPSALCFVRNPGGLQFGKAYKTGFAHVVFGGAPAPGGVIDLGGLDGTNGFTIEGVAPFDEAATSVAGAGDVNGDGYDDLLIGAPLADPDGKPLAGEAYLVFGGPAVGTSGTLDLALLDGSNGFRMPGIEGIEGIAGDRAGSSVAGLGDFNLDGYDDLMIAAPNSTAGFGTFGTGECYLVAGSPTIGASGVLHLDALGAGKGMTLKSASSDVETGRGIAAAGDMNGDGLADAIVGSPGDGGSGRAYIVYGRPWPLGSGVLPLQVLTTTFGFKLKGATNDEAFGWSVSSGGDLNGDGYSDLIVGSPESGVSHQGKVTLFFGGRHIGSQLEFLMSDLTPATGLKFTADQTATSLGSQVGSADIDGDGLSDALIGSPVDGSQPQSRAFAIFGNEDLGSLGDLDETSLNGLRGFTMTGASQDRLGASIASAGDFNADGVEDLAVGAPTSALNGKDSGVTYVLFGRKASLKVDVPSASILLGGVQNMKLHAGQEHAGYLYWILGSLSGTSPGFPAGPVVLPLNLDPYFLYSINHPNQPPLINSFGFLDAVGEASAQFDLPPGVSPILLGKTAHHAYVAIDPVTLAPAFASIPQPVLFVP